MAGISMTTTDIMSRIRGLYAITDSGLLQGRLLPAVAAALQGGAQVIQYRDKMAAGLSAEARRREQERRRGGAPGGGFDPFPGGSTLRGGGCAAEM